MKLGSLTIGHWRGVPVRMHWTAVLGAFVFSGFRMAPAYWFGYLLVIVVHELGHAAVAQSAGAEVLEAVISGVGGVCRWRGSVSFIQRSLIAWGGVLAQGVLLVGTLLGVELLGAPRAIGAEQMVAAFTVSNGILIALNLLPIPPLDGAEAWRIFRRLEARRKRVEQERAPTKVAVLERLDSEPERGIDGTLSPELEKTLAELKERSRRSRG